MWQARLQRYLLPGDIEADADFHAEVDRLGHIGLRVIAAVETILTIFMVTAELVLDPDAELTAYRLQLLTAIVSIGMLTLLAARVNWLRRHSRIVGCLSGLATAGVLTWFLFRISQFDPTALYLISGNMTLVMLVTVAALPLRPTDTVVFGFVLESLYVTLALAAQEFSAIGVGVDRLVVLYIFILTCLACALTALLYAQRRSAYEWNRRTVQTAEHLRQSETRNLLAQNAASVGRLAAALSHELNSPIGALISGVDTLLLLASRQATAAPMEQQRLVVLQNELRKSIRQSTERLKEIVTRMQRFTNLDRSEVQAANINDILTDVTALVQPRYQDKAEVQMDLQPVPELVCRPQQLSAVFSSLLGNALEATNGNGQVRVATRNRNSAVEVSIEDNGRGLAAEELKSIFDPGFKVAGGRVSTGNWSMFSSRQIIQEHGGDIAIESRQGEGTRVSVTLPLENETLT